MNLCARWFQDFKGTPEEKKELEQIIRGSLVLPMMTKIIEKDIQDLTRNDEADYDNPSWSHKMADRQGALRALRNMLKLTKLDRNI